MQRYVWRLRKWKEVNPLKEDTCRSCKQKIIWTITVNGKHMPVDYNPNNLGNIVLHPRDNNPPIAQYVTNDERDSCLADGGTIHITHFFTCPEAAKWRKKK